MRVLRRSKTGLLASGAGLAVRVIFVLYSFETGTRTQWLSARFGRGLGDARNTATSRQIQKRDNRVIGVKRQLPPKIATFV